jgi:hypothetical protein
MLTEKFLEEMRQLSRADKLRIIQMLLHDLAIEENAALDTDSVYEIWSPYDSAETAAALMQMLEDNQA